MDILITKKNNTTEEILTYILELFYKHIGLKQKLFDYKVVLCYQHILITYYKATLPQGFALIINNIHNLLVINEESLRVLASNIVFHGENIGFKCNIEGDNHSFSIHINIDSLLAGTQPKLNSSAIPITAFT
jgi:hypothetical protein